MCVVHSVKSEGADGGEVGLVWVEHISEPASSSKYTKYINLTKEIRGPELSERRGGWSCPTTFTKALRSQTMVVRSLVSTLDKEN